MYWLPFSYNGLGVSPDAIKNGAAGHTGRAEAQPRSLQSKHSAAAKALSPTVRKAPSEFMGRMVCMRPPFPSNRKNHCEVTLLNRMLKIFALATFALLLSSMGRAENRVDYHRSDLLHDKRKYSHGACLCLFLRDGHEQSPLFLYLYDECRFFMSSLTTSISGPPSPIASSAI